MLRTKDWKLVSRVNGRDELYDLRNDPQERRNLCGAEGSEAIATELKSKQLLWLMETADAVPLNYDSRFSAEMIWAKVKRLVPPEHEQEVKEEIARGANLFLLTQKCRERFGSRTAK